MMHGQRNIKLSDERAL